MDKPIIEHELDSTDHIQTFVIHLFRSESGREIALRERLDVTTNGAVVVTSGLISFSFTSPDVSHVILLANVLIVFVFLLIEARRYQVHASMRQRVRSMEKTYIAPLFNNITSPPTVIDYKPHIDPTLINSLLDHKPPINRFEAVAWRLRSIYIYLLGVTYIFWLNIILSNRTDQPLMDYINQQATVINIDGIIVFGVFTAVMLLALMLSLFVPRIDDYSDAL